MDVAGIIVGDEVLSGHVVDENGPRLAREIQDAGHRLRRLAVVADETATIAREIRLALEDGCGIVVTSGGLGPTHDDVTLEGVAEGLGVPLAECLPMRERIDGWIVRATTIGISEEQLGAAWLRRMAQAPAGAELLECSIPVPAFAIPAGEAIVCVLPGPPAQFAAALADAVLPRLGDPGATVVEEVRHPFPESMLAQVLADLAEMYRDVSIGSYPLTEGVLLRVKGPAEAVGAVATALRETIATLESSEQARALLEAAAERRRATSTPRGS